MRIGGPALGGGGIGVVVIILVVSWLTGQNPLTLLELAEQVPGSQSPGPAAGPPPSDDREARFVSTVLASMEDTWTRVLPSAGLQYQAPRLVLFSDAVQSACGSASAATGPFYCPADRQVYLDLSFFRELDQRFGAPGDFAQAYVVAHEVGHHVQNLLGANAQVSRAQRQGSEVQANALSVRLELQADCYAGVWGHHAERMLEAGDVDEGLAAAAAIGDDRLQGQARGRVAPESFTHGTSAQRSEWLRRGLASGRVQDCDTFAR